MRLKNNEIRKKITNTSIRTLSRDRQNRPRNSVRFAGFQGQRFSAFAIIFWITSTKVVVGGTRVSWNVSLSVTSQLEWNRIVFENARPSCRVGRSCRSLAPFLAVGDGRGDTSERQRKDDVATRRNADLSRGLFITTPRSAGECANFVMLPERVVYVLWDEKSMQKWEKCAIVTTAENGYATTTYRGYRRPQSNGDK